MTDVVTAAPTTSHIARSPLSAGLLNDGLLVLRNAAVSENTATATGPAGFAQGGGIWNGSQFNPPPIELTLQNTSVTRNTLSASPGLAVQGGGLFTAFPITLTRSAIAHNTPDDCFGCQPPLAMEAHGGATPHPAIPSTYAASARGLRRQDCGLRTARDTWARRRRGQLKHNLRHATAHAAHSGQQQLNMRPHQSSSDTAAALTSTSC